MNARASMMTPSMGVLRAMDGSARAMGAASHDLDLCQEPAETPRCSGAITCHSLHRNSRGVRGQQYRNPIKISDTAPNTAANSSRHSLANLRFKALGDLYTALMRIPSHPSRIHIPCSAHYIHRPNP